MSDSKPIAIFDSGLGGLTVAAEIHRQLPKENLLFLGDMARVPYASLSAALIEKYASECFDFLAKFEPKALVIACNTVSAICLPQIALNYSFPVLGVIEPTARAAINSTKSNKIGVIATKATIRRKAYEVIFAKLGAVIETTSNACPLLVPLVEEGWIEGEVPKKVVEHYLNPILKAKIDTLVMGCTHYEYFRDTLQTILGSDVKLINTPAVTSVELKQLLNTEKNLSTQDSNGRVDIYSSDITETLERVANDLFSKDIKNELLTIHYANIKTTSFSSETKILSKT